MPRKNENIVEMPRRSGLVRQADSAVLTLLIELAGHLVSAGIPYPRFDALTRLAYFTSASAKARFGNDRVNQSAVAAMTGLTRVEVRRFAKQIRPDPPKSRDRINALIEGWLTDPAFAATNGSPRRLKVTGSGRNFPTLARAYGGDVPTQALLRELQRHKVVTVRQGYVSISRAARRTREEIRIERLTGAIATLLRVPDADEKTMTPLRTINLEVKYPSASEKGRAALNRRVTENLKLFLAGVEAAGTSASIDSPQKARRQRVTRTRVLLLTEDVRS